MVKFLFLFKLHFEFLLFTLIIYKNKINNLVPFVIFKRIRKFSKIQHIFLI